MQSLRAYCSALAKLIGSTDAQVYERQRLLVRAGLLQLEGRGPGGGTKATPQNVALLVIAILAVDTLVDAERIVRAVARAKPMTGEKDQFLSSISFVEGLSRILDSPSLAAHTVAVSVSRSSSHAAITLVGPVERVPKGRWTILYSAGLRPPPSFSVEAMIQGDIVRVIATNLAAMKAEEEKKEDGE